MDTAQFYGLGTVNESIREALHPYPDGLASEISSFADLSCRAGDLTC
jgi:hypothetical protein